MPENEGEDAKNKDREALKGLMKKIIPDEDIHFEQINRIGERNLGSRSRLLKVKVQNMDMKKKYLKTAPK